MSKIRYYETNYTDYLRAVNANNFHPELDSIIASLPPSIDQLGNLILYGPSGSGKYTQFLRIVEKYSLSASGLKNNKMTSRTDKHEYTYHISDIHYEIDLAQLGCESKKMWNECFFQIVDAIYANPSKSGIILCRNFQSIYGELVEPFYSYMQHSRTLGVHIVFIFLTEHISFIPTNIVQCCKIISVRRPSRKCYTHLVSVNAGNRPTGKPHTEFMKRIATTNSSVAASNPSSSIMDELPLNALANLKECHLVGMTKSVSELPKDVFNIVCDNIIREMLKHNDLNIIELRDHLYDILLYGLDITECLWYIIFFFVENGYLETRPEAMINIMDRLHVFLKHYNNNYRPIYHLESIFIYLIIQIFQYETQNKESDK